MLVYLRAEWSAASLALEREIWTDPGVVRAARGFVDLKVDVSSAEGDAELLARFYDARTIPTTVVLDAEGTRVATLVGRFGRDELLVAMRTAQASP